MALIKEFQTEPYETRSTEYQRIIKAHLTYLKNRIHKSDKVLDIGAQSPMTDAVKEFFKCSIS
jgi:hypothetical protein